MSDTPKPTAGKRPNRSIWALPAVGLALVAVIAVAVLRPPKTARAPAADPAALLAQIAQVPTATWDRVGANDAMTPVLVSDAASSDKPQILYIGAEYCPFCASQRWALVAALSRFGHFSDMSLTTSSATDVYPNTSTFTFYQAGYESEYLDLETVELQSNKRGPDGHYAPLQRLTPSQYSLLKRYDGPPYVDANPGSIPFLLIGGRYMWSGASYSPALLQGKDWSEIASGLAQAQGRTAAAIIANANMMSAAICEVNGGQPAEVCHSAGVRAAAERLPTEIPQ